MNKNEITYSETTEFTLSENITVAISGLISVLLIYYVYYFHPVYYVKLTTEDYWGEWVTFISFIFAFLFFVWLFLKSPTIPGKMWLLLFAVTSFFIAMEEISWGQRLLSIHVPKFFEERNFQGEMTLHNIEGVWANEWRNMKIAGTLFLLYGFVLPVITSISKSTRRICNKIHLPVPTLGISPLFIAVFIFFIFKPLLLFQELGEMYMGLAIFMLGFENLLVTNNLHKLNVFKRLLNRRYLLLFFVLGLSAIISGVILNPGFVAQRLSSDGMLHDHTIKIINSYQYLAISIGILFILCSILILYKNKSSLKKQNMSSKYIFLRKIRNHKGLSMSLFLLIIIIMGFGLMISFGFEIGFKNQINDFAAQKYYNKGLHVQAEKLFEYIEKYPKLVNEQTLIYRGRNLLALNRTQEGTKLLKKELALEEIKLEQEPDNLLLLLMIAKIYSYLDKKDKADKYYHKALDNEYSKLNLELSQFDERFARLTLGDIYLEIGKYTKAISEYEMANSLSSNDLEYRELKIRIYHCQNKLYNN